jgi:hypothetical protein
MLTKEESKRQLLVGGDLMWPFGKGAISGTLKVLGLKKKDVEMNKKHAMSQEHLMRATYTDAFVSPRYASGLSISQTSSTLVQPPNP